MLVHILHDRSSAEAYCTLGGEVVPAKIAQAVGEQYGLSNWSTVLFGPSSGPVKAGAAPAMERQRTVDEGTKKRLLRVLLEVYMQGG
jgi:vacuolar protein sorting-associated protein 3